MRRFWVWIIIVGIVAGALPAQAQAPDILIVPGVLVKPVVVEVPIINREYAVNRLPAFGIGHLAQTSEPGEPGRVVYAGHELGGGLRFAEIGMGQRVIVIHNGTWYIYAVSEIRTVDSAAVEWLAPTERQTLTLITCDGTRRLVVVAVRVG
jgi:LPXTG-site transpeptidase (sortase) family protein